ncbi:hypothetical protein [Streptomyces sp. NPDC001635]|nr:hypothetical protein E4K10_47140 [Streptomyces sp. T1317-0309]
MTASHLLTLSTGEEVTNALARIPDTLSLRCRPGARPLVATGQWARAAPQDTVARFGVHTATVFGVRFALNTPSCDPVTPGQRTCSPG